MILARAPDLLSAFQGISHLTQLEIAQLMGDTPCLSLEELAAHPRLAQARKVFLREFLKVYGADPHMARLLIESARYMAFTFAIVNYSAQDPGQPETWATVGRLKKIIRTFGRASVRQIDMLISRLCDLGFLEIV